MQTGQIPAIKGKIVKKYVIEPIISSDQHYAYYGRRV